MKQRLSLRQQFIAGSWSLIRVLRTPSVRWLVVGLATILTGYLLYVLIWRPFTAPPELPAGVSPTKPELNTHLLEQINEARVNRTNASPLPPINESIFRVTPTTP